MRDQNSSELPTSTTTRNRFAYSRTVLTQRSYPGVIIFLFLLVSAYLVLPLVDLPFLGLSISAPIFGIIALQVFLKPTEFWFKRYQKWIVLALLIWLAVFFSTMGKGLLSGGMDIDREGWVSLLQYAFWLLVFVVTTYFASRGNILERVARVLGWAVFGLGLFRLYEAIVLGNIGSAYGSDLLSPNTYGFLFSCFFPYLLAPIITTRGARRFFMILRLLVVGVAVILNGSRSSWISVAVGIFAFSLLYIFANPRKIGWSILIVVLSTGAILGLQFAPDQVTAAFDQRLGTFERLEEDKSFVFRQIMVQKGWKLFQESPLIGVGASRFRKESVNLELSGVFAFYAQSKFDMKSAHNSYIALLAETGLGGSIPFVIFILLLVLRGLPSSLNLTRYQQVWGLSIFTSFLGMSLHMWTIMALTGTSTWFVYGLLAALIELNRNQNLEHFRIS